MQGKFPMPIARKNYFFQVCTAVCLSAIFGFSHLISAAPRESQSGSDELTNNKASELEDQESITRKTPPVGVNMDENIRLRRDLDEYSRTVDPAHVQIEERRRVMHQRLQERFNQTDRDNDGSISREEAADLMPQVARHFNSIDLNNDNEITLDELEALETKIIERQRAISAKTPEADTDVTDNSQAKHKNKNAMLNNHKPAM